MNWYEEKQKARKARFAAMSQNASAASDVAASRAIEMGRVIPMGQPILVGHHSERGHRALLAKMDNSMRSSVNLSEKAKYYEQKASSVGRGGISSDDPDAIDKLKIKLANCEASQELMKKANSAIKKGADIAALVAIGLSQKAANEVLKPDFMGRVGFPSFSLQNNNAEIRRLKTRIAELEKRKASQNIEVIGNGWRYEKNIDDNRHCFYFDEKPNENTRTLLKSYSLKWSPTRMAWVRQISSNSNWSIKKLLEELAK